jgi:hypothetical protein
VRKQLGSSVNYARKICEMTCDGDVMMAGADYLLGTYQLCDKDLKGYLVTLPVQVAVSKTFAQESKRKAQHNHPVRFYPTGEDDKTF